MATRTAKGANKRVATQDAVDACFAKAVADGDIVNFRFLLAPFSPLRDETTEDIHTEKYSYLRPSDTNSLLYKNALELVSRPEIRAHFKVQFEKKGPAQLHADPLLMLADNAVLLGKYTAAAQAFELLRVRRRMREEYLDQADAALVKGDIRTAVHGYLIGAGLDYDYSAFPEPMPMVPDFQARALMLHADYPRRPEDCVALQAPEQHLRTGLDLLLINAELPARLERHAFDTRLAFLVELVRQRDPRWEAFVKRYQEACALVLEFGKRLEREKTEKGKQDLAQEAQDVAAAGEPRKISARLLGREIPDGAWWQYVKELGYEHPAAVLFVARQEITSDLEIIMPRFLQGSPIATALGLVQ